MSVQRIGIVGCGETESRDLQRILVRHGYLADAVDASADIIAYCRGVRPLVLVLKVDCDRNAGLATIAALNEMGEKPLIVAAGPASDPNCQIDCLALGADDFVTQPVQSAELIERLGILLGEDVPAFRQDTPVARIHAALTTTEQGIFTSLHGMMPKTMSREEIMWDTRRQRIAPDDRTLDVYISHIRKKLTLIRAGFAIETVRGKGFRLVEKADAPMPARPHARARQIHNDA